MPVLAPPPPLVRPPAPMVRAPANYIRPFRQPGGGGGGVGGGNGGGGGGGGRGGGGWNGWGPEPGNPWWGDKFDSGLMRLIFSLATGAEVLNTTVQQNAADWEAIRDFVRAKARDLNNLYLDAPTTQGVYNSGGFAFINPGVGELDVNGGLIKALAIAIGAGVSGVASAVGGGLSQLWGYLNGPFGVPEPGNWLGPVDQPIENALVIEGSRNGAGLMYPVPGPGASTANPGPFVPDNASVSTYFIHVGSPGSVPYGWVYRVQWMQGGIMQTDYLRCGPLNAICNDNQPPSTPPTFSVSGWRYTADDAPVPEVTPIYPVPAPHPPVPEPEPLPEPQPEPAPIVPLPYAPPQPADPQPVEQPRPVPSPVVPPAVVPARPPLPAPPSTQPQTVPGTPTAPDGSVGPTPRPPTTTTPVDNHYPVPGAPPVTGNGPRPTPEGIAQELGRIEQKLERTLNGEQNSQKWDLLWKFLEFAMAAGSGGTYTMCEPCDPDGDGQYVTIPVGFGGGLTQFAALSNRIDALAELMQAHKDLRQPVCREKPVLTGEWVAINFQSDAASPGGERPLRKVLRYRDQTAAPLEDHLAHWESFAWDAGPVIVISKNLSWGTPQVWAASVAEGKRVLSHAALVAGVDLTDPKHEWVVTGSNDPRYGRTGRMRVDTRRGTFVRVTKRPGPSGLPSGFAPTP